MMGSTTLSDLGVGVNNLGQKTSIGTLSGPGLLATGGAGNSSQTFAEAAAADGGPASASALNLSTAPDWLSFDRQVLPHFASLACSPRCCVRVCLSHSILRSASQVLRFYAFFREAVTDSALENQRVRK